MSHAHILTVVLALVAVGLLQAPIRGLIEGGLNVPAALIARGVRGMIQIRRQLTTQVAAQLHHLGLESLRWPVWVAALISTIVAGALALVDYVGVADSLAGIGLDVPRLPNVPLSAHVGALMGGSLLLSMIYAAWSWESLSHEGSRLIVAHWHSSAARRFLRGCAGFALGLGLLVVVALGVQRARALAERADAPETVAVTEPAPAGRTSAESVPPTPVPNHTIDAVIRTTITVGMQVTLVLATIVAWSLGPSYVVRLAWVAMLLLGLTASWIVERALRIWHALWSAATALVRAVVHAVLAVAIACARPVHTAAGRLYRWAAEPAPDPAAPWAGALGPLRNLVAAVCSPVMDLPLPQRSGWVAASPGPTSRRALTQPPERVPALKQGRLSVGH